MESDRLNKIVSDLNTEIASRNLSGLNCLHLENAIAVVYEHYELHSALSHYGENRKIVTKYSPDWERSDNVKLMLKKAWVIT